MTANEFLGQLEKCLSGLQAEERESAMAYYREYFMDAGTENEEDAAAHLGSPQSVAERIISETGETFSAPSGKAPAQNASAPKNSIETSSGRILIAVLVLVLGFPLWIAVLSLLFALAVTIASLLFAFALCAVAAPFQGIADIVSGSVGEGIFNIGAGLFCAGLVMLLYKPLMFIVVKSAKGLWALVLLLFGKKVKK